MANAATKGAEKEAKPAEAAGGGIRVSRKGLIVLAAVFLVYTIIVVSVVVIVRRPKDAPPGTEPGKSERVGDPVLGPTEVLLSERVIPYRTIKDSNPICVITVHLEFPKTFRALDGSFTDDWSRMQAKVGQAKPLLESEIYDIIASKDLHELRGPENKKRLELEIREKVNEILSRDGKGSTKPVDRVIITELKFPQ